MFRHAEKLVILTLLIVALVLWWPLIKWHRLFELTRSINFEVPAFQNLDFTKTQQSLPKLPALIAVKLPVVSEAQLSAIRTAGLPVFNAQHTWWLGPYLTATEATNALQQIRQLFKIDGTMSTDPVDKE